MQSKIEPIELYDAISCLTKFLLGLGAGNQIKDIEATEGKSTLAGLFIDNWYYFTKEISDNINRKPKYKMGDFYKSSSDVINNLARRAALHILALSGVCDYHSDIVLLLGMWLFEPGTIINKCVMADEKGFKHSIIVIGDIVKEDNEAAQKANDKLWVIDSWASCKYGVVPLKEFWLRRQGSNDNNYNPRPLKVSFQVIADGVERLFKRVVKQKNILGDRSKIQYSEDKNMKTTLNSQQNIISFLANWKKPMTLDKAEEYYDLWDVQKITGSDIYPYSFSKRKQ
jgi:hypothetical protein